MLDWEVENFGVISLLVVMVDYTPLLFLYPAFTEGKEQFFSASSVPNAIIHEGLSWDPDILETAD